MKKVKILTIILAIILIIMIGFFGIYKQVQNRMENQMKEYSYSMDFKGVRSVRLALSKETETIIKDSDGNEVEDAENLTDEEITEKGYTKEEIEKNSEDTKTLENYRNAKKIIEKRLEKLNVDNYIIKLNEKTGEITLEIAESDDIGNVINSIITPGEFEIVDSETGEILLSNDDIENVTSSPNSNNVVNASGVAVNIKFNKEGKSKFEEITSNYKPAEETNTVSENTTTEGTESDNTSSENTTSDKTTETTENKEKTITMKIDDQEILTTSFDEPIRTGVMQLSMGGSISDIQTLKQYAREAENMATVLNSGKMPLIYELAENQYIVSNITNNEIQISIYVAIAILVLLSIILIMKYKKLGLFAAISNIGFIAGLLILIRAANVVLSIEGILGIAIVVILNYVLINKLLKTKSLGQAYKNYFVRIIPIVILSVVFSFVNWRPINSFGMVMVWGIILTAIYNSIITNSLIKIEEGKEK